MSKVNEYIPLHYVGKRIPVKLDTGTETLVEQSHEETTNINKIVARYRRSGGLPPAPEAQYADVSEIGELMDVKLAFTDMQNAYAELPEFIKDKLPFADIGNVDDETLQEMFANANHRGNENDAEKTPDRTGGSDSQDDQGAQGGVQDNQASPATKDSNS